MIASKTCFIPGSENDDKMISTCTCVNRLDLLTWNGIQHEKDL